MPCGEPTDKNLVHIVILFKFVYFPSSFQGVLEVFAFLGGIWYISVQDHICIKSETLLGNIWG